MTTFADRQRDRRAAGQHFDADFLAGLEATSRHLRAYAEGLMAAPVDLPARGDAVGFHAAFRRTVAGVDRENADRELAAYARRTDLGPSDRERIVELARWRRAADRGGVVGRRPR